MHPSLFQQWMRYQGTQLLLFAIVLGTGASLLWWARPFAERIPPPRQLRS